MISFKKISRLPVSAQSAFEWHERPGAFERMNPPWDPVGIRSRSGGIEDGATITIAVAPFGLRSIAGFDIGIPWTLRHEGYEKGVKFCDVQVSGPFKSWRHTHRFTSISENECELEDFIEFELPFGCSVASDFFLKKISIVFDYRHRVLKEDLIRHGATKPMSVVITGASGMVGSSLTAFLTSGGHTVYAVVRRAPRTSNEVIIDGDKFRRLDGTPLEHVDVAVNLAGEPILGKRWDEAQKHKILQSRVETTRALCKALLALKRKPDLLLSASGINYYGFKTRLVADESAEKGEGFLADVTQSWEREALLVKDDGIRVIRLRLGVVLSPLDGALKLALPTFKLGLGGVIGDGSQFMSWISLPDLCYLIYHCFTTKSIEGVVHGVAKKPTTNAEFTKVLGDVLNRFTFIPVPQSAVRVLLGDVAQETVLSNLQILSSEQIDETGFQYLHPDIDSALRFMVQ
jgi:uncharacterized protein